MSVVLPAARFPVANRGARCRLSARGADHLTRDELLAVVVGRELAASTRAQLWDRFGPLRGLRHRSPRELAALPGIGPATASRLLAALELGARAACETGESGPLSSSEQVFSRFQHLGGRATESFWALGLDVRNRLLRSFRICEGSLNRCVLKPADVLTPLLREGAAATIVVHNHPSGDPEPSPQDVALTRRLQRATELVGVELLDHVVVATGGYVSLRERGLMRG